VLIGIGIDLVDIERFRIALARTPSMRTRLFTEIELAYVEPQVDPIPSLAARFAAREAVMKSLGVGLGAFGFHDVWVERATTGAPSLVIAGQALELADAVGVTDWHLSLTHSESTAGAYVVAESNTR
jgi:holo-[acyl-carrier protein] synthase